MVAPPALATAARALWVALAGVAACVGLGVALWSFHEGSEHVLSVYALLRYAVVVLALAPLSYAVERLVFRLPPTLARTRAVVDAAIAGLLVGPVLYAVLELVETVRECSSGGC